ncbi:MAG TPA: tetratricopeptide repeat protein [Myxococcota bacterium]|nr:tetratricopeptide repeat protein [Myxococcota bacterium]
MHFQARLSATLAGIVWLALAPLATGCASFGQQDEREAAARQAKAHLAIGADHLKNGRNALALHEFLVAEKFDPRNAQVQNALGEGYFAQNKRVEAEAHYRRALELAPDYHDARLSLSVLYIVEERYADAAVECQKLLDDPTFPAPWRALANLGFAELQQKNLIEARKHLTQALEYQKEYWPARLTLAQVELSENRKREALSLLSEVLALSPAPSVQAQANYEIAQIYVSLGQREEAVAHLTTAVAQTPDGLWGRRSQESLKQLR